VILAHLGGLPIEESLIYLVPPIAVVAWIYVLGRRERGDPPGPPYDGPDAELDDGDRPLAPGGRDRREPGERGG
jgi:hypothetical protein